MDDKRRFALLAVVLAGTVVSSGLMIGARQAETGPVQVLVDVAEARLQDGWGRTAVESLSMYYSADASKSDVEMLAFRPSLLPVFDWGQEQIPPAVGGDLYDFYASGAGLDRVQNANDPAYAFTFTSRFQEPAGRTSMRTGAGYALSLDASQSRVVASDYQNWNEAGLGTASGIDAAGLENLFHTRSSYGGFGPSLTRYEQNIRDVRDSTRLSRKAWQTASSGPDPVSAVWSGRSLAYNSTLPSTLIPPPGVSGTLSLISQKLLGNYFAGAIEGQGGFVRTDAAVDVLGQWHFSYDPNLSGSSHVFRDDTGRVRFFRANPDLTNSVSQGFRYFRYDQWGRPTEFGVLLNVAKSTLADYGGWAREADLDAQLIGSNSCPVFTFSYDVDPVTGSLSAYDERRGGIVTRRYFTTAIADQPTDCPGRGEGDPISESLYQYDDLGRTQLLSEHRQSATANIYRTTGRSWPSGGLLGQLTFPDQNQSGAFITSGQGSMTGWPNILGRKTRLCGGADCSNVKYLDITGFDWASAPLTVAAGNGVSDFYSYDLRGNMLGKSSSMNGNVLFAESLRSMQIADSENPCPGSTNAPDFSAGLVIARYLSGNGLPQEDQGVWDCYSYDGALRLQATNRYQQAGASWQQTSSYDYSFDDNGNVESIAISGSDGGGSQTNLSRGGSDQIISAALASGDVTAAYEATYGSMTRVSSSAGAGYSLNLAVDPVLNLSVGQSVANIASGVTLLSAAIDYDANGLRASRTVNAGSEGSGSSTTEYWYGGGVHPLVIDRDGVTSRMIGKSVVEQMAAGNGVTRAYLYDDHGGSVRMITDDAGTVTQSLGYDGDWGSTRITGQDYAASYGTMASFYRYKGEEQEIFPLSTLEIDDSALARWLDELQLYHFPLRDYASGLAAFLQTDPFPSEDSPYAAFGADPANFGDDKGAMFEEDGDEGERIEQLLDQLLQNPQTEFDAQDRYRLRLRLSTVERGVQNLVDRSEALMDRITNVQRQVEQTQAALQIAREQQASYHAINLFSQHIREGRAQRIRAGERNQYIAIVRHTAEDLSNRRMSPLESRLSNRYLWLRHSDVSLQGARRAIDAERQDLENWLDIYQFPIGRMWDPDEAASEAEEDDDEEFFSLPSGSPVNSQGSFEDENSDNEALGPHDPASGSDRSRDRNREENGRDGRPED